MRGLIHVGALAVCVFLPAAVIAYRASTEVAEVSEDQESPQEQPQTHERSAGCRHCAALRHPSQHALRTALAAIPKQGGRA